MLLLETRFVSSGSCWGDSGVIQRFCCWKAALLGNPAERSGKVTLVVTDLLDVEFFLDSDTQLSSGECEFIRVSGLLSNSGGELRAVPLRTWHVGHSLTNLEISSFGTLCNGVSCTVHHVAPTRVLPGIHTSNLRRGLITPSMLTLLMCFGKYFEQFFSHCYRLAFVADFAVLMLESSVKGHSRRDRLTSGGLPSADCRVNIFFTQNLQRLVSTFSRRGLGHCPYLNCADSIEVVFLSIRTCRMLEALRALINALSCFFGDRS